MRLPESPSAASRPVPFNKESLEYSASSVESSEAESMIDEASWFMLILATLIGIWEATAKG